MRPEGKPTGLPASVRRELIIEQWRAGLPTSEIARTHGVDEAEVCRVIEEMEDRGGEAECGH